MCINVQQQALPKLNAGQCNCYVGMVQQSQAGTLTWPKMAWRAWTAVMDEEAVLAAAAAALTCDKVPACDMLHVVQCHSSCIVDRSTLGAQSPEMLM